MEISVCNFGVLETGLRPTGYRLSYAFPLEVSGGDLDRKTSSLSGETDLHELINEESSGAMSFLLRKC